jgi:hypothetical protein
MHFKGRLVAWSDLLSSREKLAEMPVDVQLVRTATRGRGAGASIFWIDDISHGSLQDLGITSMEAVMSLKRGKRLRKLADRENWYLPPLGQSCEPGLYLKKHRVRSWATCLAALLCRVPPRSAGRVEAENALLLEGLGIPVMRVVGFGERLLAGGCQESFFLSEELVGYHEAQAFIADRFRTSDENSWRHASLRRLITQMAEIARQFHAAGYNHRDFYCCHFLVRETSPAVFDVRLIDLQRVEHRKSNRRRWIVKDLAQLASMAPKIAANTIRGLRHRVLFLRQYFGVASLRKVDCTLLEAVASKEAAIRKRAGRQVFDDHEVTA